jgi:ABC-type nitrate/sulfonate/bicarbonate transport system substrate-binding protein
MRLSFGMAAALVALSVLPARAEMALTVAKASPTSDAIIPVNVGDELGIFKKHGLALTIIEMQGGAKMAQAVTAGSADIGDGAGSEMAFVAKGAPMIAVCEDTAPAPFLSLGVPADSPIKSLDDMRGKSIGVSNSGSFSDWSARILARTKGWGDEGVKTVAVGNGVAAVGAMLKTHQIDAMITGTNVFLSFEERKEARIIAQVSTWEGNVASGALFASNDILKKNPDAVRAFLAGWIETVDYMRAHKAETVTLTAKITHFSESVMDREYDLVMSMFTKDCRFDAESLKALKQSFADLKLVEGDPDMSKLYTHAYLPK